MSKPPPVASADRAEASCAASPVESWLADDPNSTWLSTSSVGRTGVEVSVAGDVAVLVCHENVTIGDGHDVRLEVVVATNLYLRTENGWRMIHHHASPAPVTVTQPFTGMVQ